MSQLKLFDTSSATVQQASIEPKRAEPSSSDIDQYWKEFEPFVKDLKNKGFRSICEVWWRSRYYDFLYPGHQRAKNKEEHEYRAIRQKSFSRIWQAYQHEITKH